MSNNSCLLFLIALIALGFGALVFAIPREDPNLALRAAYSAGWHHGAQAQIEEYKKAVAAGSAYFVTANFETDSLKFELFLKSR